MKNGCILVVDDDPHSREIVRTYLEARGYEVETAPDGPRALEALDRALPALVLLDVMMPGMDGWELARRIRARPGCGTMTIIMLTARSDAGPDDGAANESLQKPIQLDELARRVRHFLGQGRP